jgi:hypothetical protein
MTHAKIELQDENSNTNSLAANGGKRQTPNNQQPSTTLFGSPLPDTQAASQLISARVPVRQISGLSKFLEVDLVASSRASGFVGMSENLV